MRCVQSNHSYGEEENFTLLFPRPDHGPNTSTHHTFVSTFHVVNNIIMPAVFTLGIIGNTISLCVFSHKRLRQGGDPVERSATFGLITLAASDLLFCLVGLPAVVLQKYASGTGEGMMVLVGFYYDIYKNALMNTFLFSSTWLIVLISAERFLGVCFPFKARGLIRVYRTLIAHSLVFVLSVIVNLPLFFKWDVESLQCIPSCHCYVRKPSWLLQNKYLMKAHLIIWFTIGTFVPLFVLLFCNVCILRAIYRSRGHIAGASDNAAEQAALSRITWTLLTMVLCYFLLVCPSTILQFIIFIGAPLETYHSSYAVLFTNLSQAIKFSSNFLLYCAIHKRFREALGWSHFTCPRKRLVERPKACSDPGNDPKLLMVQIHGSNGTKSQEIMNATHV